MSHVSTKSAARYRAGDLGERRSAAIRRHLSGCARCSQLDAGLRSVPALLSKVQVPPLPAHLEARISQALAAESARRSGESPAGPLPQAPGTARAARPVPAPGRPDLPERPPRSRHRGRLPRLPAPLALRVLAAAGAAAIIAGGGYGLLQLGRSHSVPATSIAGAPGSGANARQVIPSGVPLALQYERGGRHATVTAVSTGTRYQPGTLAAQVRRALPAVADNGAKTTGTAPQAQGSRVRPPAGLRIGGFAVAALEGCVSRVAAGRPVLLVNVAYYRSGPAAVIVTPAGGGAVSAWVVGISCSASQSDILAHTTVRR